MNITDVNSDYLLNRYFDKLSAELDLLSFFNDMKYLEPSNRDYIKHSHEDSAVRYLVARSQDKGNFNRERTNTFAHGDISTQLNIANLTYQL